MTPPSAPPRVLVAEDVRAISTRIEDLLTRLGCEVEIADDGEACLRKIASFRPDLVILDLMMPRMTGLEVLRRVRNDPVTAELEVLVCTAKDFATEMHRLDQLGVSDVVIKPFDFAKLEEKIVAMLGGAGSGKKEAGAAGARAAGRRAAPDGEGYVPALDRQAPHLVFWGTRGSIPVSGPEYARHGGNTSCLEFVCGDRRIVFDAGSGIRALSAAAGCALPEHVHLFITHTHWDHIQGFPFFVPIYRPGGRVTVYGEGGFEKDPEALLGGQLDHDYFPVGRENIEADLEFRFLDDSPVEIGDIRVSREFTLHPGPTVAFKVECPAGSFAYVPDNEFLLGYRGAPHDVTADTEIVLPHERFIGFLEGVDLLLHEAQYLATEYRNRIGWGHSNLANACLLAKLANVRRWLVIHHDPSHDDAFLDHKLNLTRHILREIGHPIDVRHAHDGLVEYL